MKRIHFILSNLNKKYTFAIGTYLAQKTELYLLHFFSQSCGLIAPKLKATLNKNQPMARNLFAFIVFTMSAFQAFGQTLLTKETNAIRASDRMTYRQMEACAPGGAGRGQLWDFSDVPCQITTNIVFFSGDSLSCLHRHDSNCIQHYTLHNDNLEQYGDENRLARTYYYRKKLSIRYPFQFGDSLKSAFEGYGRYCGNHIVKVKGKAMVQADGEGTLVLSANDTVRKVLRVHTVTSTAMAMDVDFAEIDSSMLRQEIEERYEWYAMGYRYPLYVIIQRTSYTNLEQVGTTRTAYRLLPEEMEILDDAVNDSIKRAAPTPKNSKTHDGADIFHYDITCSGKMVDIAYTCDTDANLTVVLASYSGILYDKRQLSVKGGDSGHIPVSTSGLLPGRYVIYINVNGKVYSKTVNVG